MAHVVDIPANVTRTGNGVPANSLGDNGDLYLNLVTGRTYRRLAGTYVIVPNDTAVGDIVSPVNGQFIKGSGGAAIWAPITTSDITNYPRITKSAFTGGPPTSPAPVTGDRWIGQLGAGGEWEFEYDSAESTVYKWKFRGGPWYGTQYSGGVVRTAATINTWYLVPNCVLGGLRNGFYNIVFGGIISCDTATTVYVGAGPSQGVVFNPYQYRSAIGGSSGVAGAIDPATTGASPITSGNLYLQVDQSIVNANLGVVFGWISCAPIKVI